MTLLELLHLLKKRLWLVILLPVLCAAGCAIYAWGFMDNTYTATVELYALSKSTSTSSLTQSDVSMSQQIANDLSTLVTSASVEKSTALAIGEQNLASYTIKVSSATTNRVIKLEVTGKNPEKTALVANSLAEQVSNLATSVMDLEVVNIVSKAEVPTKPSGPNRLLYTGIAALAGLFLAICIIVLADSLSTSIKSSKDIEERLGIAVIGKIPYEKSAKM